MLQQSHGVKKHLCGKDRVDRYKNEHIQKKLFKKKKNKKNNDENGARTKLIHNTSTTDVSFETDV